MASSFVIKSTVVIDRGSALQHIIFAQHSSFEDKVYTDAKFSHKKSSDI